MASLIVSLAAVMEFSTACGNSSTSPSSSGGGSKASSLAISFGENPVPFRSTGCNASVPQGWYTSARIDERGGVTFAPSTLTQKLDGNVSSLLAESFGSRFGACSGMAFTEGEIQAGGATCGTVGICTTSAFGTYQFTVAGTDANGHSLSFDSPVLQFGPRPAGQSMAAPPVLTIASPPSRRYW
jgi:hypothetical protein